MSKIFKRSRKNFLRTGVEFPGMIVVDNIVKPAGMSYSLCLNFIFN